MIPIYPTVLIADDEKNTREGLEKYLETLHFDVITASDGEEAWQIYQKEKPDLVLADIRMPKMTGTELLKKITHHNPHATVILLTAYGTVEDAVKAMKMGAFYYLTKPVNLEELEFLINKALSRQTLEQENKELKKELIAEKYVHGDILAESSQMKDVLETVDQIAKSESTVLITGESGTGKELIAHRIHQESNRHHKPFIAVHCAALTETLLASELFGHEKGAFTGASERKVGRFERAHQGTLFLDEIGEISQETQVKLLRVLQEGEFERVGGVKTIKADVRIICATNKNLKEEVKAGRFREDLYYRINVILLKVPPLRQRREDIPFLVEYFIKHFARVNGKTIEGIEPLALEALVEYNWPGNVRELKNIIERMIVLSRDQTLTAKHIPDDLRSGGLTLRSDPLPGATNITEMEKGLIQKTLAEVSGNKSLAAKKLGISRRTLYRKLEEYHLSE